jgi:hypothetical protein
LTDQILLSSSREFEHFCRIVAPRRWQDVCVLMLTVCFDAGGKEHHEVLVVAGFASVASVWTDFENQWQSRLEKDNLKYFHAGDFAQSNGQFKSGWKDNEPRRRKLSQDLMEIIQGCGLRKFGCVLEPKYFYQSMEPHKNIIFAVRMKAFTLGAVVSADEFYNYAIGQGITRNLRCVFEKGDPEDALRAAFRGSGYTDPDFAWSKPHTDRKGVEHDPFLGLQAAGWIAYEYYLEAKHSRQRWAFNCFEDLIGHIKMVEPSESMRR